MKIINSILLLICILFFVNCSKPPEADFTASKDVVTVCEPVTFTINSTGAKSYKWELGPGSTSTDEHPTTNFYNAGPAVVKLNAYSELNQKGTHSTKSFTITVIDDPYKFSANIDGQVVTYTDIPCDTKFDFSTSGSDYYDVNGNKQFDYDCYLHSYLGPHLIIGSLPFAGDKPTKAQFANFIKVGSYSFDMSQNIFVNLHYYIDGKDWGTEGDQTGSTFNITSAVVSDITNNLYGSSLAVVFKANFNCKLHDQFGNTKILTDGYIYFMMTNP